MNLLYHIKKRGIFLSLIGTACFIFFALKLVFISFRYGDGNEYVYMSSLIWKGILPYRDYFFVDPPGLILILSLFYLLLKNSPLFFQLVPVLFEIGTALMLCLLLKKHHNRLYWLAPAVYLSSFTVFATSDYITGVSLVVCFSIAALLLWEYEHPILSGLAWALAVLVKLYTVPLFAGWLIYVLVSRPLQKRMILKTVITCVLFCLFSMLPFALVSFHKLVSYIIFFHFQRTVGIEKIHVLMYFVKHEWLLLLIGGAGLFTARKKLLIGPLVSITVFFSLFPDMYYLYLNVYMVFLVYFAIEGVRVVLDHEWAWKHESLGILAIICYVFLIINWVDYASTVYTKGRFLNAKAIALSVKSLPKPYLLFGSHEVVPLLSLLSGRGIVQQYIDTNPQGFGQFGQNKTEMGNAVVKQGAYILSRVVRLKEEKVTGYEEFFDRNLFELFCKPLMFFPSTSQEHDTHLGLFECKK